MEIKKYELVEWSDLLSFIVLWPIKETSEVKINDPFKTDLNIYKQLFEEANSQEINSDLEFSKFCTDYYINIFGDELFETIPDDHFLVKLSKMILLLDIHDNYFSSFDVNEIYNKIIKYCNGTCESLIVPSKIYERLEKDLVHTRWDYLRALTAKIAIDNEKKSYGELKSKIEHYLQNSIKRLEQMKKMNAHPEILLTEEKVLKSLQIDLNLIVRDKNFLSRFLEH